MLFVHNPWSIDRHCCHFLLHGKWLDFICRFNNIGFQPKWWCVVYAPLVARESAIFIMGIPFFCLWVSLSHFDLDLEFICVQNVSWDLSGAVFLVLILCGVQIVGWSLCGSCDLKVAQFGRFSSSSVVIAMWELFPAVCQLGILFGEFKAFLLYLSSCQLLAFVYRISSSWFRLVWAQLLCWWSQSGT